MTKEEQKTKSETETLNRIILIGNGFDRAHNLKTKYEDFIKDFWRKEIEKSYEMKNLDTNVTDGKAYYIFKDDFVVVELKDFIDANDEKNIEVFKKNIQQYKNKFLRVIESELYEKKWCDIENLYYKELIRCLKLKKNENDDYSIKQLNNDFKEIKEEFKKYLDQEMKKNEEIASIEDIQNHLKPSDKYPSYNETLFLNFNYTNVEKLYAKETTDKIIHIHGELNNTENEIIFGYGDELDDDYREIEKQDNKEFLENLKFISYLKTKNYESLLDFMNEADYEIYIWGHSCGNSDRTLLNFMFENESSLKECKKIRIFYHDMGNGKTNYNDIIKDISRQFKKKSRLRELVTKAGSLVKAKQPVVETDPCAKIKDHMIDVSIDENCLAFNELKKNGLKIEELKNFKISKYQVTQEIYDKIMKKNPSSFSGDNRGKCPVEQVSWYDCVLFCNKLSERYGLEKYYNISGEDVTFNFNAKGFRLPTEAEWEYAARGGREGKGNQYAGCNRKEELKFYAWFREEEDKDKAMTHPVGQKKPNELGIYDMSGNVWEWCEDWYDDNRSYRVLRGGSWYDYAEYWCVADRYYSAPGYRDNLIGFRLAVSL